MQFKNKNKNRKNTAIDLSSNKKEDIKNIQVIDTKKETDNEMLLSLKKKRKKSLYIIIGLSSAIVVLFIVFLISFVISNRPSNNNSNSSTQIVNANVNEDIWGNQSSSMSSNISSQESEMESSSVNTTETKVKPSTGKVTTAPEFKYDPTEDVPKKDVPKENVDKGKNDKDEEITIPVIPDVGASSSSSSKPTSSSPSSSSNPSTSSSSSSNASSNSSSNQKNYVVMTDIDNLNVRSGAGVTYASIGKLVKEKEYPYLGEGKDSEGIVWYRIQYNDTTQSWVSSQYSQKLEKQGSSSSSNSSSSSSNSSSSSSSNGSSSGNPPYQTGWNTIDGNQYYFNGKDFVKGWANIGNYRYYFDTTTGAKRSSVGIDVSYYQGDINWNAVKSAGVEFAFIRVGFRGYETGKLSIDPKFVQNITNANKAGVKVGVYFYSTAATEAEGAQEADFVLNAIQGYQVDLPIVIDVEHRTDRVAHLTNAQRTNNTLAFLNTIKNAGKTGMLYTGHYFYNTYLESSRLKSFPLWIAYYTNNDKNVANVPYKYWQYTDSGKVNGISGAVDLNVMIY